MPGVCCALTAIVGTDCQMYPLVQAGVRNHECLSLGCDRVPLFDGRTPLDVYHDFIAAFSDTFRHMFGMPPMHYALLHELSAEGWLHLGSQLQQPRNKMPC